ncbi:DNA-processing protein DprA [Lentibacter algarum]|uniref:DNA-processing protein DprA n=1 Tax=Lentibacter algarum TaxID=576131 RepID=UPI001C08FEB6|nr:DNA-processing protein DprA [Lentibacter algarum]MBU2982961.1 DNA-processing protein DprA [Lentibacter algarum]
MAEDYHPSTHPPFPPSTEDEQVLWLRLLRSRRVGIATFYRLLGEHGSAAAALVALPALAQSTGVSGYQVCTEAAARDELCAAAAARATMLCIGSPNYPRALLDLSDPPPILWVRGQLSVFKRAAIGMVGARNASSLGGRTARALARGLSEKGQVVVSGLARGIDTCAHISSLSGGTIAVLAGGVDVIYPAENAQLADDILEHGALISEQPMGLRPQARHFPRRNRLISGLSEGLVVVEAASKSGSLITARNALDQGREVLAVPGHPFDARASGCNMLIRDGATLVRSSEDVLEALQPLAETPEAAPEAELALDIPPPPPEQRDLAQTTSLHQQILDRLGPSPLLEDQLIRDLARPPQAVTPVLIELELDGKINRAAGGMLSKEVEEPMH